MTKTIQNRQKGVALMIALILLLLITALAFGVIVMSNTENAINTNFKSAETTYFAVLNGVTLAQVMTPSTSANPNPFFDSELCHDIPGGAGGIVQTPANVRCTTMVAPAMIRTTPSIAPYALDYKWVRVMIKENGSGPYEASNASPSNYPVCWDKSANPPAETATPLVTNCAQGGSLPLARPVYLVTALAVSPSGTTRRMVQEEVALSINYNPDFSVFGVSKACPAIEFTVTDIPPASQPLLGIRRIRPPVRTPPVARMWAPMAEFR